MDKEELKQAVLEYTQFRLRLPNKPSQLGKSNNDFHIRAPQIRRRLRRLINIFGKKSRRKKR